MPTKYLFKASKSNQNAFIKPYLDKDIFENH